MLSTPRPAGCLLPLSCAVHFPAESQWDKPAQCSSSHTAAVISGSIKSVVAICQAPQVVGPKWSIVWSWWPHLLPSESPSLSLCCFHGRHHNIFVATIYHNIYSPPPLKKSALDPPTFAILCSAGHCRGLRLIVIGSK